MIDAIRRFWSACLRGARLRPPRGHMDMLRGELGRREDARVARDADTARKLHAPAATAIPDARD
jgi:hypothetical protein